MTISRRDILRLAAAAPAWAAVGQRSQGARSVDRDALARASARAVRADGSIDPSIDVVRLWVGPLCRSYALNRGPEPVRVKEIVLFDVPIALQADTVLY